MVRCGGCGVCIRHGTKKTRSERLCGVCRGIVKHINRREPTERAIKRVLTSKRLNPVDLEHFRKFARANGLIHDKNGDSK